MSTHGRRPQNDPPTPPHMLSDPDLATVLRPIVGSAGVFRHRQHIHLTFVAVHRYGMPAATDKVKDWIRQIAAAHRAPQKYHETLTRAWVELVAHHVAADSTCADFDAFAERHPDLLDKHLVERHYCTGTLMGDRARRAWIAPDLRPFP